MCSGWTATCDPRSAGGLIVQCQPLTDRHERSLTDELLSLPRNGKSIYDRYNHRDCSEPNCTTRRNTVKSGKGALTTFCKKVHTVAKSQSAPPRVQGSVSWVNAPYPGLDPCPCPWVKTRKPGAHRSPTDFDPFLCDHLVLGDPDHGIVPRTKTTFRITKGIQTPSPS